MATDPFTGDKSGELFPGFPYDLDSSPYDTHPLGNELQDIFDRNNWDTWGDFAEQRWVHTGDAYYPEELRESMSAFLDDMIIQANAQHTLSFTDFYYTQDDDMYHWMIPDNTP